MIVANLTLTQNLERRVYSRHVEILDRDPPERVDNDVLQIPSYVVVQGGYASIRP